MTTGPGTVVALLAAALPFSLRGAYPVLAIVSGSLGSLVVVLLVVARLVRSGRAR